MSESVTRLTVRPATIDDAPLVRDLMLTAFESLRDLDPPSSAFAETVDDVAAAIERGGAFVAWFDSDPVGSVRFEPRETWLYIGRLAVIPTARRKGVATALMHAAESQAPVFGVTEAQVQMRSLLQGNRAFFTSLGYELLWERPHPRNPEFAHLCMRKHVP